MMRNLIIGTAGHIDHGKTELIKALTGTDTDRLKDEKARGISIDLGFARFPMTDREMVLGVVDVPGHEAFVRNMLAGVTGIDLVLFVIAADEGVMPQTREHLDILRFLEVERGLIVITKADLVEEEWIELVVDEARDLMRGTFMEDAPVVVTSTRDGRGLDTVMERLVEVCRQTEARPADDLFRLPVDRVFTIRGRGTVVTGTIWSGAVQVEETVTLQPSGLSARVKSLQVHSEAAKRAVAGTRVALALAGVAREEIGRGATVLGTATWEPTMMIDARLTCSAPAGRPLRNRARIRFHLATQEVMGRVVLLEGDALGDGADGFVQFRLEKPVIARWGDRFVIRSYSPITTIGGGSVLVPYPRKHVRLEASERVHLETLDGGELGGRVESLIRVGGMSGYPSARMPIDAGSPPRAVRAAVDALQGDGRTVAVKDRLFHVEARDGLERGVIAALTRYHEENPLQPGVNREELGHRIEARFSPLLLDEVLSRLERAGRISGAGGGLRLVSHQVSLDGEAARLGDAIIALLNRTPLSPPDLPRIAEEIGTHRARLLDLLSALQRLGRVVKIDDSFWLTADAARQARACVVALLRERGEATASELRAELGVSRKYAIPILEHLDRAGVTIRRGDRRGLVGEGPGASA